MARLAKSYRRGAKETLEETPIEAGMEFPKGHESCLDVADQLGVWIVEVAVIAVQAADRPLPARRGVLRSGGLADSVERRGALFCRRRLSGTRD